MNALPAILILPDLAAPIFAATLKETEPFPAADVPPLIVIQAALLVAVHVQPVLATTLTDPLFPPAGTETLLELRL
jgi:hypothetical protein